MSSRWNSPTASDDSQDLEAIYGLADHIAKDVLACSRNDTVSSCGGTIIVDIPCPSSNSAGETVYFEEQPWATPTRTTPVSIRFESGSDRHHVLRLPLQNDETLEISEEPRPAKRPRITRSGPQKANAFQDLLDACEPATFGREGKDVLDETYRKALKLNTEQFDTNFCPYTSGIINTITQVLLPGILDTNALKIELPHKKARTQAANEARAEGEAMRRQRGVRAELYKLNIYRAGDKFKAHVDTPRGNDQIGSLVVALPSKFTGGALHVRKLGREDIYNWSTYEDETPAIHWAAFYSDCDHEVMTVESGYRITLTYNLFVEPLAGLLVSQSHGLCLQSMSLYNTLSEALKNSSFVRRGGRLGIYLYYNYPHTHSTLHAEVWQTLKGIDMILYEMMRSLGLRVKLIPVVTTLDESTDDYIEREIDKVYNDDLGPIEILDNDPESESELTTLTEKWGTYFRSGEVLWLNKPKHSDLQALYLAYGNQSSVDYAYTAVAMIVNVP